MQNLAAQPRREVTYQSLGVFEKGRLKRELSRFARANLDGLPFSAPKKPLSPKVQELFEAYSPRAKQFVEDRKERFEKKPPLSKSYQRLAGSVFLLAVGLGASAEVLGVRELSKVILKCADTVEKSLGASAIAGLLVIPFLLYGTYLEIRKILYPKKAFGENIAEDTIRDHDAVERCVDPQLKERIFP